MPDLETAANEDCVGPSSEQAGKASGCEGCPNQSLCASGAGRQEDPELELIGRRLAKVRRKVLVLSGKGGVGKSTMSAQLGFALAARGLRVGLLDVDICGPSIPQMLGLRGQSVHRSASGWSPVYVQQGCADGGEGEGDVELGVMSVGFMTPSDDDALIWRGPRKNGLIKQFLSDVDWGELDFLLIDTPPGTSDEHISLVQLLGKTLGPGDGAVVVSTPQEVAMLDVRKELSFCAKTKLRVLGVVENMAGLAAKLTDLTLKDATGKDVTNEAVAMIREAGLGGGLCVLYSCRWGRRHGGPHDAQGKPRSGAGLPGLAQQRRELPVSSPQPRRCLPGCPHRGRQTHPLGRVCAPKNCQWVGNSADGLAALVTPAV